MRRFRVPTVILVTLICLRASAADLTPDQIASAAKTCKKRAVEVAQRYDSLAARMSLHGDFARDDLVAAKPAYDAETALWQKAGAAFEKADATEGQALRDKATEAGVITSMWRERLEVRVKEAEVAPHESSLGSMRFEQASEPRAALDAYIESKKAAADAWCAVAEAMTPNADPARLVALREAATRATGEAEMSSQVFEDALRRFKLVPKKMEAPPDVAASIDALKKLDEQRNAMRREDLDRDARARELDRQRQELEKKIRDQVDAAKKGGQLAPR